MLMLPTGIIYAYYALPDMWDSLYGALFAGGLMLLIFLLVAVAWVLEMLSSVLF